MWTIQQRLIDLNPQPIEVIQNNSDKWIYVDNQLIEQQHVPEIDWNQTESVRSSKTLLMMKANHTVRAKNSSDIGKIIFVKSRYVGSDDFTNINRRICLTH